ncbi:MAG: hypothetical protein NTW29_22135 [Bacteroidetes bacterium]|nr:hypothetical protein [Bacteroidota bacterium]
MKRKLMSALMLLPVCALVFVSCQKQAVKEETAAAVNVEKLAEKFTQPIDNGYGSLRTAYNNLNEEQLKAFYLAVYRINSSKGQVAMTENKFMQLFDQYNIESKKQFNQPLNRISDQNLVSVFDPAAAKRMTQKVTPGGGGSGCEFLPYPEYYYWASNPNAPYSPASNSSRIVDFYLGDCDGYELTYNAYYNKLRAITPLGAQAIALFLQGDHINVNGTKTRVLHKKSSADWWFGNVAGINANIRMANEMIAVE